MRKFKLEFIGFPKKDDPTKVLKELPARASPDVFKKHLVTVYNHFFITCKPGQHWGSCAVVLKANYNPACPDLINTPEEPFGGVAKDIVEDYVLYGKVNLVGTKRTQAFVCNKFTRVYKKNPEILSAI